MKSTFGKDFQSISDTMPAVLLERLPLPSLQTYVTISVVFLASALLYTHHTVITAQSAVAMQESGTTAAPLEEQVSKRKSYLMSEPEPNLDQQQVVESLLDPEMFEMEPGNLTLPYESYELNFLWVLTSEAWCVWVSILLHFHLFSFSLFFLHSLDLD